MKQKITLLFSIITTAVILLVGCNKSSPPTAPPPDVVIKDTVNIAVEDITHRSIAVNVKSTANNSGWNVSLYRTLNGVDTLVSFFAALVKDTTIIDDNNGSGLMLNTEYKYYAILTDTAGKLQEKTNPITAKTLAPTSHNFTWQEYIIGDDIGISSNSLYDVWGTDDNHVWAVGSLKINGTMYGVLYWNGSEWIPDSTAGGYAIFGFSKNDIWTVGGGVYHFDGIKWNPVSGYLDYQTGQYIVLNRILSDNGPYTSIWGTSSNNLYLGNQWGKIVHWNGTKAKLLSAIFTSHIRDIWGFNENDIYIISEIDEKEVLYHFNGQTWSLIKEAVTFPASNQLRKPLRSIWGYNSKEIFIGGRNIYFKTSGKWKDYGQVFNNPGERIRGTNSNNTFIVGHYGLIGHFNGIDWIRYDNFTRPDALFFSVFACGNSVFVVGEESTNTKIIIGKK